MKILSWNRRRETLGDVRARIVRLREKEIALARGRHSSALQQYERGYVAGMREGSLDAVRLSADVEATGRELFRLNQELEALIRLEQKLLRQDKADRRGGDRRYARRLLRDYLRHAMDHQRAARQAGESFNAMHDIRIRISDLLGRQPGDAFEPFTEGAAKAAFSRTVHEITKGRWTVQKDMGKTALDADAIQAVLNSEFPEER